MSLDAGGMPNSVEPDQTVLTEQSDLSFYCLLRPICSYGSSQAIQIVDY